MLTWFLTTKLGRWLAGAFAVIAAFFVVWLEGRSSGKKVQKQDDDHANAVANQKSVEQVQKAQEDRVHVDYEVQKLPDVGPQPVENADPSTAAGKLRSWMRP